MFDISHVITSSMLKISDIVSNIPIIGANPMTRLRRHLLAVLAIVPLSLSGLALAADPPSDHLAGTAMETLQMVMQDIPGPEYAKANQLKNEAMHALLMSGGDLAAVEPKLKAFAAEFSRVSGGDPKG